MRRLLASAVLVGLGLALPAWAFAQATSIPVIPPVQPVRVKPAHAATPVWQHDGNTVSVTAAGREGAVAPTTPAAAIEGRSRSAEAGVSLTTKPGISAHASVRDIRFAPLLPECAAALSGTPGEPACFDAYSYGVQRGEIGAGFAAGGVKLDLSVGQAQSDTASTPAAARRTLLPRVLPAAAGADVTSPMWFRNSTATSINARGQVNVAPDTSLDVGASLGRVRFLPGSGLGDDSLDQTTVSLGVRHGAVRGAIVGHVVEPTLPGGGVDPTQRWSTIDLGISVRLPWRGELNFGAQNVWTSGRAPLVFGPAATTPDQGRVPYVQYHQDL